MDEVAGLGAGRILSLRTPADLADTGEDIGDRLLLSMMMNPGARSRFDLEQSAPKRRIDTKLRRHRRQPFGTWRLGRSRVEFFGTDDTDRSGFTHDIAAQSEG